MSGYHFMYKIIKRFGLLLLVCGVIFCGLILFKEGVLVIEDTESGEIVWQKKLNNDMKFAIKYLHSVERTPVWEYFKVEDGEIFLTGTRYQSYGAGLPFLKKHNYVVKDDYFIISGIDDKLNNIPLRVSDYAKHRFIYNNTEYRLYKLLKPQSLALIKVENITKFKLICREVGIWVKR